MNIIDLFEKKKDIKSLYCSRNVLNGEDIIEWAKTQGFETCLPADEMHVTVAYSKKEIDWEPIEEDEDDLTVKGGDREVHEFNGNAIVLQIENKTLHNRWKTYVDDYGASYDFDEYKPHVTITYEGLPKGLELDDIEPYKGKIEFGPEIIKPLSTKSWKTSFKEIKLTEKYIREFKTFLIEVLTRNKSML